MEYREYKSHGKVLDIMRDMLVELNNDDLIAFYNKLSETINDKTKLVLSDDDEFTRFHIEEIL